MTAPRIGAGTALRVGAAVALAVVAGLAALLAADVRAWPVALDRGDAAFAVAPRGAAWTPSTDLGGLSGSVLGVDDDLPLRRGLMLYQRTVGQHKSSENQLGVEGLRAQTERALAVPAGAADPRVASQARTLLGVLAFGAAARGGAGVSQTDAAISDFTDAVTVDPSNTAAKYDLELLLRLTAARGLRSSSGPTNGFGRTGSHGAAGGAPGSGY